jgi:hypothetical protein
VSQPLPLDYTFGDDKCQNILKMTFQSRQNAKRREKNKTSSLPHNTRYTTSA